MPLKKIALVLSGGGVGAFSHVGVLKVLEEYSITPNLIVGTSGGAIMGAWYAGGVSIEELENIAEYVVYNGWKDLLINPIPKLNGLISGENIKRFVEKFSKVKTFEEMKIPLFVTCTELKTFTQIVYNSGSILEPIQASCSIPGFFTPVIKEDKILVDGGIYDNLPCKLAKKLGADFILASDCFPPLFNGYKYSNSNAFYIIGDTMYKLVRHVSKLNSHLADYIIRSEIPNSSILDFKYAKEFVEVGEKNTRMCINDIIKLINKNNL